MSSLKTEFVSGIAYLTLDNPESANSFGVAESKDLQKFLKNYREPSKKKSNAKSIHGLVFQASPGRTFSSGGNLRFYSRLKTRQEGLAANQQIRRALGELAAFHAPTVALVDGDCWGGGMELLSCFDFRVATPRCQFGFWQRRNGLSFGWGGFERWTKHSSAATVRRLALTAEPFSAYQAQSWGIVDQITPAWRLLETAQSWLLSMKDLGSEAGSLCKTLDAKNEVKIFSRLWLNASHK